MRPAARSALAAVALALVLTGCGLPAPATTLVVGAIYPLSGPQAEGGREELAGLRTALEVARRHGVPHAAEIRLRIIDATTPEAGIAAVDRLVDHEHAALIVGTYGSTIAVPTAAHADSRAVVYWETGAVADEELIDRRYVFRTVATGANLGRIAVDFTTKVLLPRDKLAAADARVAIVQVDDVYGRSVADGEAGAAAAAGIKQVARIRYDPHAYSAADVVARIAAARPDYLWDVSYLDDGITIWNTLAAAGLKLRGAVGTSSAFCQPDFGRRMGDQAVGLFAADKPSAAIPVDALSVDARSLLAQASGLYAALAGEPMEIPGTAGFVGGWTLFHDVLPAVKGGFNSESIRAAALAVDAPYGSQINGGGVRFAPPGTTDAGQNRRAAAVVGQWQRGPSGAVMRWLYPNTYATGTILPPT